MLVTLSLLSSVSDPPIWLTFAMAMVPQIPVEIPSSICFSKRRGRRNHPFASDGPFHWYENTVNSYLYHFHLFIAKKTLRHEMPFFPFVTTWAFLIIIFVWFRIVFMPMEGIGWRKSKCLGIHAWCQLGHQAHAITGSHLVWDTCPRGGLESESRRWQDIYHSQMVRWEYRGSLPVGNAYTNLFTLIA